MGKAHRSYAYQVASKQVTTAAKATPFAVCWRCGRTLQDHPRHRNGKRAWWTAGHTIDGSETWKPWLHVTIHPPAGDWLACEGSTCNLIAGSSLGGRVRNAKRVEPHSERW